MVASRAVVVVLRAVTEERLAEICEVGRGVVLVVAVHRERENTTSQRVDMARR